MGARSTPMVDESLGGDCECEKRENLVFTVRCGDNFVLRIENDAFATK